MLRPRRTGPLIFPLLTILTLSAACAASSAPAAAPPAGTSVVDAASTESTAAISGTVLTEVALDNKFTNTSYILEAGRPYTLLLANKGDAIHDWHLLGVKSPGGKDITSPLVDSGKTAQVSFTIAKPGTYRFQCDVHPDEMKGTLTVQ